MNLSYHAIRPVDIGVAFAELEKAANIRRVILSFDVIFAYDNKERRDGFPFNIYDTDPTNRFLAFDLLAIRLTYNLLRGAGIKSPWTIAIETDAWEEAYKRSHTPFALAKMGAMIRERRLVLNQPSGASCSDFPAVNQRLLPFARSLDAQGRKLDIIIPPYSLAYYYMLLERNSSNPSITGPGAFDKLLVMRRCLVNLTASIPNTRVFAFDDDWLVTDFSNFKDPGHLRNSPEIFRYMLQEVNAGRHTLTPAVFEEYERSLRHRVEADSNAFEYAGSQ